MALGGFPGHGTTQYTSVHHHSISHNDGDDDAYNGDVVAPGYVNGGVAAGPGYVNGGLAGGYNGVGVAGVAGTGVVGGAAGINGAVVGNGYLGGLGGPVNRYGVVGGPAILGNGVAFGNRVYRPRHVHVGVGTPGVKVEVETAKSVISSKPMHVNAQVFRIIYYL